VVDFGRSLFERFDDKKVLLIGAGEMGEETIRFLCDEGATDITVVNRNPDRAARLAARFGGQSAAWDALLDQVAEADLIVSTTGADRPVVRLEDFRRIEERRAQRTLFVLDLAMPRDFEPAVGDCLGVYLYSIDDLRATCDKNRKERDKELPAARRIVEQETVRFMADLYHRATGPIIKRLKQGWQQPAEDELRRLFNKLPELDERSRAEIRTAFDRLVNKLLHPPLESLRDEARSGVPHGLLEALKRLFQLKD
jgi:glutamyl-tRNA reductase